jgi:hypothetical protein
MFLFDFFRSFLPLHNPIGFGASDWVELALAALLVLFALARARFEALVQRLAQRTGWSMALLALAPVVLRLALLPQYPVPTPGGSDDFSHLLVADTLLHFRLANPPHPLRQFFEAIFVVQEPGYSSIFPIGQGMALAAGRMIFGNPWAGVVLSVSAFCALCYWMLRAWTTAGWALVGGLLAVFEFGPLNQWMNGYWGGAVSACAGCLVFGALPRLRERDRTRDAVLLGLGLAIQLLSRPFESGLLVICVIPFLAPSLRTLKRPLLIAALVVLPAIGLTLLQNKQVTGSWTTVPYLLSRYQYGIPTTFTFQPNPIPHRELTAEQHLDYEAQTQVHGKDPETIGTYFDRFLSRAPFYRFFFLPPLYLALPFFLLQLRERRFVWVLFSVLVFALGDNFYPYFYPHYIAAAACLFLLIAVTGLARISRFSLDMAALIVFLCAAHFVFWYGLHASRNEQLSLTARRFETWDFINSGDPEGRIRINHDLAHAAGKQLVFVRYGPQHMFHEWVHNAADIDGSQVVWACDLGPVEDEKLRRYYPDRTAWIVEPDAKPPKLVLYSPFLN